MLSYEKPKTGDLETHFEFHPSTHYILPCSNKFMVVNVFHLILWLSKIDLWHHHICQLDHKLIHLNTLPKEDFSHFHFDKILNLKWLRLIY